MDELEQIRNRIKERKGIPESNNHKSIVSLFIVVFIIIGVYMYKNDLIDYEEIIKHVNTMPSFILSPFEDTDKLFEETVEVSSSFPYRLIDGHNYTSDNNEIVSLFNGLVVYVGYEDSVYKIIVSYENNIQIVFDNVKVSYVELYDRVLKDDIIGIYDTYFTMTFKENNEDITFEEVIEKY